MNKFCYLGGMLSVDETVDADGGYSMKGME